MPLVIEVGKDLSAARTHNDVHVDITAPLRAYVTVAMPKALGLIVANEGFTFLANDPAFIRFLDHDATTTVLDVFLTLLTQVLEFLFLRLSMLLVRFVFRLPGRRLCLFAFFARLFLGLCESIIGLGTILTKLFDRFRSVLRYRLLRLFGWP